MAPDPVLPLSLSTPELLIRTRNHMQTTLNFRVIKRGAFTGYETVEKVMPLTPPESTQASKRRRVQAGTSLVESPSESAHSFDWATFVPGHQLGSPPATPSPARFQGPVLCSSTQSSSDGEKLGISETGASTVLVPGGDVTCQDSIPWRVKSIPDLPPEILALVCRYLLEDDDSGPRYFYRPDRELLRRHYLQLHPGAFSQIRPKFTKARGDGKTGLWPLVNTCCFIRNSMLEVVFPQVKRVLVNMLDLELFTTGLLHASRGRLRPLRFRTVSVFVPDGYPPALPVHPILSLVRSNVQVKLEFSQVLRKRYTADMAADRSRLEKVLQCLLQWPSHSGTGDSGTDLFLGLLDKLYVHPDGQLDVALKQSFRDQFPVPREWKRAGFAVGGPEWIPTGQQLRAVLSPLHALTDSPVWLDITVHKVANPVRDRRTWMHSWVDEPKETSPCYDAFPFPDKPHQERGFCQSEHRTLERAKGPCIQEVMIGDPYGLRVHPAAEFFESSTCTHHLRCLRLPMELSSGSIFLKLFARGHTSDAGPAVKNARKLDLCDCFCVAAELAEARLDGKKALEERNEIQAKHIEYSSKIFTLGYMEGSDSDSVSSTQESCVPVSEGVEQVLTRDDDETLSVGDESVPSEYRGVMAGEKDGPYLSSSDEELFTDNDDEDETMLSDSASDTRDGETDDELLTEPEDDDDMVQIAYPKL